MKKSGNNKFRKSGDSGRIDSTAKQRGGIADITLEKCSSQEMQLENLVQELESELHYTKDRIVAKLIDLKSDNKIQLVEKTPYAGFASYAFSPSALWYWFALIATILSLVLISVSTGLALYLRYLFGGLLVLFLPGFSLVELLYSKRKELDDLTRVALSIGLSLAIVPLTGLVLNYTPWGIRLLPVAVSLVGLTVILLTLALRRKHAYYKLSNDII